MSLENRERPHSLAIKSLKNIEIGFTDSSRRRLAVLCQEARIEAESRSLLARILSAPVRPVRFPLTAAALGVFMAFGVAILMLGNHVPAQLAPATVPIRLVSMTPGTSGGVTLKWTDGNQRVYRVLKSTNPCDFSNAANFAVRGNRWTDTAPGRDQQVVYYKVE